MNLLSKVRNPKKGLMDPRTAYGHEPMRTVRDNNTIVKSSQSVERSMDDNDFAQSLYQD